MLGMRTFLISGGQFEDRDAGEPARLIRAKYLAAGRSVTSGECIAAAVVINDIDTGLGKWGELVQTTINTQSVYGELMHLADFPTSVEGVKTPRIPIIATGNDFTKLYNPLIRAGRMDAFEWNPSAAERVPVVNAIFPHLEWTDCEILSEKFSEHQISFFSHLRSKITDKELWCVLSQAGVRHVMERITKGEEPQFTPPPSIATLVEEGLLLATALQAIRNHLSEKRAENGDGRHKNGQSEVH